MAQLVFYDGAVTVDTDRIANTTKEALLARAIGHILHNEAASAHPKTEDGSHVQARFDWAAKKVASLYDGTLGVRQPTGPRVDPVEQEYRRLREAAVRTWLRAHNIKTPKREKGVEVSYNFGAHGTKTHAELLASFDQGPKAAELRKVAERNVKASARAVAAEANGAADPSMIGA